MSGGGGAMMCKGKFVFSVFASFLILTAFAGVSAAKTIYVPDDYAKIQWAVDNASVEDTIVVRDGVYVENVVVNKKLTIKSENGSAYCIVDGSGSDVFTLEADGIRIEGFTITGGYNGIYICSNNNTIINNDISSNNWEGIDIRYSNNNIISKNNISSNNDHGIDLCYSNNNSISENNICSNNDEGIYLYSCLNNNISNNEFINDGLFVYYSYGNIVEDNKVNGKPLVYLEGKSDEFIYNAGQVILVKCKNITIMNSELTNTDVGIELFESDDCLISNNNISNNDHGIDLCYSNNNSISNNDISSNYWYGIDLSFSNNNSISENIISSNNGYGILLCYSNNNSISNNEFINDGLFVYYSYGNIVENNTVNGKPLVYLEDESDKIIDNAGQIILVRCKNITVMNAELTNTDVGIELFESDNCLISNNNISSNNYYGILLWHSNNNSIFNNIISSNNEHGINLDCSNNNSISENNICSNNDEGIYLYGSNNNSISENIISSNNDDGIYLYGSNNNPISKNDISSNYWHGIFLYDSNNNIIYMNNFIKNTYNTDSYGSKNIWNSTEPITYTYKGSNFTNYMGNYWDDYTGSDANGDGIGETPYSIDSDKDNYPLIERFEHYFVETPTPTPAQIFDTGRPENPYPSISGKFIGTIKANKKIIATKLYTYACEGTGGHTEHALICNSTWCAEAKWEGYKEDWMNISFNRTVVLMPHETYNITIVTGSYPQIHHTSSLKTENGWINCTEFIDANGKKYNDWIPAIMLWS